jgi:transcriptional regulator with XRE-family HTH domain
MNIKSKMTKKTLDYLDKIIGDKLTFGNMLANIRECDGISQADFAKTLGVSRQYLCDVEHDRKIVSPKKAYEYAKKLGYCSETFIMLALQAELDSAGLPFDVEFAVKPKKRLAKLHNQLVAVR